jgi:putative ABC transport system permease protein
MLSHAVTRRTREFGVRQALGADRRDLVVLVLRELRLVGMGVVLGLGLSFVATRWLTSMLYGLKPHDPWSLILATAVLLVVTTVAAYIPARRASRVEPMSALRFE